MCMFHSHMWIQTGVRVRKRLSWVLTSVTLTFDLWPWPFAWTSLLTVVITPENFMMIRWWEHGEKGVTDGQTDRQTDGLNQSYSCLVAAKKIGTGKYLSYLILGVLQYGGQQICWVKGITMHLEPTANKYIEYLHHRKQNVLIFIGKWHIIVHKSGHTVAAFS